jgi:hypothetical protein
MKQLAKTTLACAALALLSACGGDNTGSNPPQGSLPPAEPPAQVKISADFNQSVDGWLAESTDYGPDDAPVDIVFQQRALPAPLTGKGYYMTGRNKSDDLFLYVKKQFGGFVPSTSYKVSYSVQFATDVASGCMGVGGSPGESVWVVGAASAVEPKSVLKDGRNTLNIDRGNQAGGGKEGQVLGTIGNTASCGTTRFESKTVKSAEQFTVKTDANGKLWLLVGIDSGFEATSSIYLQSIVLDAERVK